PRAARSRATADMPVPPMPTTWYLTSPAPPEAQQLVRDDAGRLRLAERLRGDRHAPQARRVVEQSEHHGGEALAVELALTDHLRRARFLHRARVRELVAARGGTERDEDERLSEREGLRDRRRARAPDDDVRGGDRGAHLIAQERVD